jgi:transposase
VRTEDVPWARPGARHTKDFTAVVAWLAQRVDKTTITKLLRVSWEAVAKIVIDVVGDVLEDSRFEGLRRVGVDEVSYRKGHRYLTVVADHDRQGRVVWAQPGKSAATLTAFFDELGPKRVAKLEAISLDMSHAFEKAVNEKAPHVRQCVDPFHLIWLANEAINQAVLEPRTTRGPEATAGSTATRRGASPRPGPLDQAHPLGTLEGPGELER